MNYLIGDSRVRGFRNLLPKSLVEEVWAKPGGKILDMEEMINDLTILHHGETNVRSHFYIWVGICNLTKRLRERGYEEVIFCKQDFGEQSCVLYSQIESIATSVFSNYGVPIFCPIIPMHLETWNNHRLDMGKTTKLLQCENYAQMQEGLEQEVVIFNNRLIQLNKENGFATPMIYNDFAHSRGKGRVTLRYKDLVDGCHPNDALLQRFKKSLTASIRVNKDHHRS